MAPKTLNLVFAGDAKQLTKSLSEIEKSTEGLGSKLSKTGDKMSSVGKKMTVSLTLPILAIGGASFKASSDLIESLGKTDVAFKGSSQGVKDWASSLDSAFGLTKRQALDAAGGLGLLFTNMGLTESGAADMAKTLAERAADMGSLFNAPAEEVAAAIQSAFIGESEPIRRFGVILSEEKVKAEAYASGIAKMGQPLTDAQKIQARYNIIMRESAQAHGDAARTAGTAAGQMRTLKADVGRASEELGMKLLPIGMKILEFLSGLVDKFSALPEPTQNAILIMMGIAAVSGPILSVTGKLTSLAGFLLQGLAPAAATASAAAGGGGAVATGAGATAGSLAGGLLAATAAGALLGIGLNRLIEKHFPEFNDVLEDFGGWIYDRVIPALNAWGGKLFDIWNWGNKIRDQQRLEQATRRQHGTDPQGFSRLLKPFQHGGFVPAGVVQPALLHGPEWVIPANRTSSGPASAQTPSGDVVIKIGEEVFARIAIASLLKYQRANGQLGLT